MNPYPIGIDLGTTNSCCGVYKTDRVELITYNSSHKTIPSVISYNTTSTEIVVGTGAKYDLEASKHRIYDSKRLIGRKYNDPALQSDYTHWPFKVVNNRGYPLIEVIYNNRKTNKTPTNISAEILKSIKKSADTFIGTTHSSFKKTKAVITVPAYFTNEQKMETKKAAEEANLKVIQLINEPTAAAIAYADQLLRTAQAKPEETLLIYDFGGGTFDVSIIKVIYAEKKINVLATDGDSHLGGEDIDQIIMDHLLNKYREKKGRDYLPRDEENRKRKIIKIMRSVEESKVLLSTNCNAYVDWYDNDDESDEDLKKLTRAEFDSLIINICDKTMEIVDKVINSADLVKSDIDRVVLVGGSSRIVKVKELLKEKFPTTTSICSDINPDEVVATGATLYANKNDLHYTVSDVVSHDIFIDVYNNDKKIFKIVIAKNTPIPITNPISMTFATYEDMQNCFDITLFEGDDKKELASKPFYIDKNHPKNIAGCYKIECTFNIDENGLLMVRAKDLQTGNTFKLDFNLFTRSY